MNGIGPAGKPRFGSIFEIRNAHQLPPGRVAAYQAAFQKAHPDAHVIADFFVKPTRIPLEDPPETLVLLAQDDESGPEDGQLLRDKSEQLQRKLAAAATEDPNPEDTILELIGRQYDEVVAQRETFKPVDLDTLTEAPKVLKDFLLRPTTRKPNLSESHRKAI